MAVTVVDGGNLEQAMAEAGMDAEVKPEPKTEPKPEAKDAKAEGKDAKPEEDDADDVEDEEGTTARQKRELSTKMLKAIGKKHRQVKEAEEFAAHNYREKIEAERQLNELREQAKAAQPKAKEEVAPTRADFATEDEFIDAKIKWGVEVGIRQKDAERAAANRTERAQAQYAKAMELVPDFEQVVSQQMTYPREVVAYMLESDMFAELGYHFGKNPDVLKRLVSLNPVKQLVELGKIEAILQPFGATPKAGGKSDDGKAKAEPSAVDTGFSPSKARSDAPVIKPLTGGEGTAEPDQRGMTTRQQIEHFQKTRSVNLHARKRH